MGCARRSFAFFRRLRMRFVFSVSSVIVILQGSARVPCRRRSRVPSPAAKRIQGRRVKESRRWGTPLRRASAAQAGISSGRFAPRVTSEQRPRQMVTFPPGFEKGHGTGKRNQGQGKSVRLITGPSSVFPDPYCGFGFACSESICPASLVGYADVVFTSVARRHRTQHMEPACPQAVVEGRQILPKDANMLCDEAWRP